MCIKGPESWWIAKSITHQLVVNQSKVNPQRPKGVVDREIVIDFAIHQLSGPLISTVIVIILQQAADSNFKKCYHPKCGPS